MFRGKRVAFHAGSEALSAKALSKLGKHEYNVEDGEFWLLIWSEQKPSTKKPKYMSMTKAAFYSGESFASSHTPFGNGLIVWHLPDFGKCFKTMTNKILWR